MTALLEGKTETKLYSKEDLMRVNRFRFPSHVAIVMDGNRRFAKRRGLPAMTGHFRGAASLTRVVRGASELGIQVLTVYAFSTENWKRPPVEVNALMRLFKTYLLRQKKEMIEEGVRLNVIGDTSKLPKDVRRVLEDTLEATREGKQIDLVVAFNYGARDEIKRAVTAIVEDCLESKLSKDAITEEMISGYLDTARWKDPDLVIRTGGESRISNFLLWQISYSEVLMTNVLWPDFNEKDLLAAVLEYQTRETRIGK
ncbi:MAG: Isoprenyl transferase [Chlamydiae bacterium]|nr:Isoprenyl transferase [Chlamydiota bacterium]